MAYTWAAVYQDGNVVTQLGEDGVEKSTAKLPREGLLAFALVGEQGVPVLVQHFDPGQRFIYRRRTALSSSGASTVCHLVGWQQTVGGQNVQHVAYVFEGEDRIEMAGRWKEDHPWFYGVVTEAFDEAEIVQSDRP